jgi:hypothetical protein
MYSFESEANNNNINSRTSYLTSISFQGEKAIRLAIAIAQAFNSCGFCSDCEKMLKNLPVPQSTSLLSDILFLLILCHKITEEPKLK